MSSTPFAASGAVSCANPTRAARRVAEAGDGARDARQAERRGDVVERSAIGRRDRAARRLPRAGEKRAIGPLRRARRRIQPVHRQPDRELGDRAADRIEREVAGVARCAREPMHRTRDALVLGRELPGEHAALAVQRFARECRLGARHVRPQRGERRGAGGVVQQRRYVVHEVVACRAVDAPVFGQAFVGREDLLDDDIRFAVAQRGEPAAQLPAVSARIREPVDVIDPHAVDEPRGVEAPQQRMHVVEHGCVLDAHAGERRDVEKAAPVDFVGGGAPPRQAVMLLLEQAVQHLARARDARIEAVQHRVERARPARGGVVA